MQLLRWTAIAALTAALMVPGASAAAQDAASGRQSDQTARSNRAAAVPDETVKTPPSSGNDPASTPRTAGTPPSLSYGPVLIPRGQAGAGAPRKDPAEVRDETDTLTRSPQAPAAAPAPSSRQPATPSTTQPTTPPTTPPTTQPTKQQQRAAARRHPSLQPEGAMSPRPLRSAVDAAGVGDPEPIPAPALAPQPIVPSSSVINSCHGSLCHTTSGANVNLGVGNAGVNSSGRLCARTGTTVQCF